MLKDSTLDHLSAVVDLPDLTGTRYEVEREIGRGGMGVVYAALDRELGRRVALKVLRLEGEARLIANLEHPAIVPIYDAGMLPDGRAYYTMKLVEGARLDRFVESHPSLTERLRVIQRIGEALAFAHSRGTLHRDLKPQNVTIGAFGEVYVMDWGIEGVAGTPQFRAPEQTTGLAGERSDVYSLGALLRFLISENSPRRLRAIAAKAMSQEPQGRYSGVGAMLLDIQRFQDGLAVEAFPEKAWHKLARFGSTNRVLLLLLAAYLAVRFFLFFLRRV
ncbi:MAG: serine/threonine-protein kinase [Bryobacteraceae bacterium]|jgi:serine/threonine protein kinase